MINAAKFLKNRMVAVCIAFGLFLAPSGTKAAELQTQTLDAWNNYVHSTEQRIKTRADRGGPFLWMDEDAARASRVKDGAVEILPVGKKGVTPVANGLIHDWIGVAFLPNTSLNEVLAIVRDYDRYKDIFNPEVTASKSIGRSEGTDQFSMRVVNKVLFLSVGLDGEYRAQNVRVDDTRSYRVSYTTQLREIQNYGQSSERELAPDEGDGFIWRLYSATRFEERDGGVYVETEAIALTRDVPASLRFLVTPVIKRLSRNSLLISLERTRAAVHPPVSSAQAVLPPQSGQLKPMGFQH